MVCCTSDEGRPPPWERYGLPTARPPEGLDLTGLTVDEFQRLVPSFEPAFQVSLRTDAWQVVHG
jgi:hypothetical protein